MTCGDMTSSRAEKILPGFLGMAFGPTAKPAISPQVLPDSRMFASNLTTNWVLAVLGTAWQDSLQSLSDCLNSKRGDWLSGANGLIPDSLWC